MDHVYNIHNFSFFRAPISNCNPGREMTLQDAYDYIKRYSYGQTTKLRTLNDKDAARTYKSSKFDFCTFSGVFTYRDEHHLVHHSGLMCMDFDHLDNVVEVFRKLIADARCPTALLFRSPSGDGLKWVVPIDVSVMPHEEWFDTLAAYVKEAYDLEADKHCRDITRACFLPHDPNVYMDPDVFSKPLFIPDVSTDVPSVEQKVVHIAAPENVSFETVIERIEEAKVDIAPEYYQWLSLGFALSDKFGEEGRPYYHRLSKFNPGYNSQETDRQYDCCLKARKEGITVGTFYYLAKRAGIDIGVNDLPIPSFTPLIKDDLPYLLEKVCALCQSDVEADMMVLSTLTAVSSTIHNVEGKYAGRKVYPNLYTYVVAPASAGKGRLALVRYLVQPIHDKLRETNKAEWEEYRVNMAQYKQSHNSDMAMPSTPPQRMFIIPANCSATAMYQILSDNNGVGFMIETEGDTLANSFLTDHGNYSDGLRKIFHNEPLSYMRRTHQEYVELLNPRLSSLLSGTPGQVRRLIPDAENGLFSRFMYYNLELSVEWNDVFSDTGEMSLDEEFVEIGKLWYVVYQKLSNQGQIRFSLTPEQQKEFNARFEQLQHDYVGRCGVGFISVVRRMGLIVFRIAMNLTLMRCLEYGDAGNEMICEDRDFHTALIIGSSMLDHAVKLYLTMPRTEVSAQLGYRQKEADRKKAVYQELPDTFQLKDAIRIGQTHGLSLSTVKRWLKSPQFTSPSYGKYCKSSK